MPAILTDPIAEGKMDEMPTTPKSDTWNPQQYHAFQKERSAPFFDLMALIKKEGTHFRHALDLGCGTGELTKILQVTLEIVDLLGVDSSPAMLEKARQHEDENLKFREQSIEELLASTPPESQDLVFSNASLHWCRKHAVLLEQIYRTLKKSGQLAIQMPSNFDYPTHLVARQLAQSPDYAGILTGQSLEYTVLGPEEYSRILNEIGFREQHVRLQVYPHSLKSRDEVIEWVKGTLLTQYERALGADYPQFLSDYRTELFKRLPDQKPFFYPFKRLHLWARK